MRIIPILFAALLTLIVPTVLAQEQERVPQQPRTMDLEDVQMQNGRPLMQGTGRPEGSPPPRKQLSGTPMPPKERLSGMPQKRISGMPRVSGMPRQQMQDRMATDEARCSALNEKTRMNAERFETARGNDEERHNRLVERLKQAIEIFSEKGYDTVALEQAVEGMDSRVEAVEDAFASFMEALESVKELECTASKEEFQAALETTKDELELLREARVELRDYYKETVRPALQALKDQIEEDAVASDSAQ